MHHMEKILFNFFSLHKTKNQCERVKKKKKTKVIAMKIGNANVYRRMILAFLPLVQRMGTGHKSKSELALNFYFSCAKSNFTEFYRI